jgi:hypothetical protein
MGIAKKNPRLIIVLKWIIAYMGSKLDGDTCEIPGLVPELRYHCREAS